MPRINVRRKGSQWERDAAKILAEKLDGEFKRIPGSGAIGTILEEPHLTADIIGSVRSIANQFKIEAKVGYGGEKQFALKKEWLDKIKKEAEAGYAIPMLVGKFSGSREGVQVFMVLDIDSFARIIRAFNEMYDEVVELHQRYEQNINSLEKS